MSGRVSILSAHGLSKAYGGVAASSNVTLDVVPGEVHGLIGPNGAGKSTLVAMLAGDLRPDSGQIFLEGQDITGLSAPKRTRLGIRRSFQKTSVFPQLTALENAKLAVQVFEGRPFGMWRSVSSDKKLTVSALDVLAEVGIADLAHRAAGSLSHGECRHLELAMALVCKPRLLLLDEPFAGMGRDETDEMVERIKPIKGKCSILLIEHDLDAVFALADRITVLVLGRTVVTDLPSVVRSDPSVHAAYFGTRR
jgi:branched-chain amino acid transport system ATP-binding protein